MIQDTHIYIYIEKMNSSMKSLLRRRLPGRIDVAETRKWIESRTWTPETLKRKDGVLNKSVNILVKQSDSVRKFMYSERERRDRLSTKSEFDRVELKEMSVADFIDCIENQSRSDSYYYWTSNDVFDDDIRDELWNTFQDVRERNGCKETGLAPSIWMGGLGTCTQAHYDVLDNIFIQLHGEKQFHLWPPSDIMSLHFFPDAHSRSRKSQINNVLSPNAKDHETFPFLKDVSEPLTFTLGPGDVLFIPSFWVHYVEVTSSEASVSINSFNEENTKRWAGNVLSHPAPFRFGPRKQIANVIHQRRLRENTSLSVRREIFRDAVHLLGISPHFLNRLYISRFASFAPDDTLLLKNQSGLQDLSIDQKEIDIVNRDLNSLSSNLFASGVDETYVNGVTETVLCHVLEKWALSLFEPNDVHVAFSAAES